jgi:phosphopantetheinyl transferase (holo-ACP synthase)
VIGNDVVDLQLARIQSNWKRERYLDKLFTATEQKIIFAHKDPEIMVWVLWSMKEAAYKIYNRQTGIRGFFPAKLGCNVTYNNIDFNGIVRYKDHLYYSTTTIVSDIIHTVAVINQPNLDNIIEGLPCNVIKNNLGLPHVFNEEKSALIPASVSHHGRAHKVVSIR